ncbi:MAG: polymer-forming cytoskeletal [Anaerosporomusa subterranea]|jgi:cytoskeletal protein CcmA (bactofilin family)|nr:polymer-forming cytoskeletal [Anaerosporomusa subterranea]
MFGGKRDTSAVGTSVPNNQVETIIGKDTIFRGTISSNSGIRIDGKIEGEITTSSDVIIGPTGIAEAQINARNAVVAGRVIGNVNITEKLELSPTATVQGDVKVGVLVIGEGAVYKGACEMRQDGEATPAGTPSGKKNNK